MDKEQVRKAIKHLNSASYILGNQDDRKLHSCIHNLDEVIFDLQLVIDAFDYDYDNDQTYTNLPVREID